MKYKLRHISPIVLIAIVFYFYSFLIHNSIAANDGQIGTTSSGSVNISLSIPKLIRIKNLADVSFPTYSGSGDLSFNKDITIAVNYSTGGYRITATGSGAGNAFMVIDGSKQVPYSVLFNKQTGVTGASALTPGTSLTGLTGAVKPIGSTVLNANYQVKFLDANLQAIEAGNYSGILTLVVAPE
ncbi:MAG: hypothetical protein KBC84_00605 [Proteobacteria bacterium]|nr:hypothetical protein [Pseudomonadota bacterium]